MATPLNSFQQQRAALMSSGGLDPSMSQAINAGIASLVSNADNAARQLSRINDPNQATPNAAINPQNMQNIQNFGSVNPVELAQEINYRNAQQQTNPQANMQNTNDGGHGGVFGELLRRTEGGGDYDTLFGHSQRAGGRFAGVRPTQMTIGQMLDFQNPNGAYGNWVKQELARTGQEPRIATPAGAGQIVGTTLKNAANAMGLSRDTLFDARTQNQIIDYLAKQRLSSARNIQQARAGLRSEWEGFKNVPNNQLDAAIAQLGFNFR